MEAVWPQRLAQIITAVSRDHPEQWSNPTLDWITQMPSSFQFSTTTPTREQLSEIISSTKALPDSEIHNRLDKIEAELNLHTTNNEPSLLIWARNLGVKLFHSISSESGNDRTMLIL